jgi:teichuronic acid biosynthesis glycosyltransferase TuaC
MRALVVCSANSGRVSPFVQEQAEELSKLGVEIQIFPIVGKGIVGYLGNWSALRKKIKSFNPDLVHAHSGMSALLCGLQRSKKVLATFHGSDVNNSKLSAFTRLAIILTHKQIVVSEELQRKLGRRDVEIIPCGVNTEIFIPSEKTAAKTDLGWLPEKKYILFSSAFNNSVKNYPLAAAAIESLNDPTVELVELKNRSRNEVATMLNACDVALLSSFSEGSPQFIKEALSTGTPVVSTNVGDVTYLTKNLSGCYIVKFEPKDLASQIKKALEFRTSYKFTEGPERINQLGLSGREVGLRILKLYSEISAR